MGLQIDAYGNVVITDSKGKVIGRNNPIRNCLEPEEAHCALCEEDIAPHEDAAEMYDPDPASHPAESVICHAACGDCHGYVVA